MIYRDVVAEQLTRVIVDVVKQELNREPLIPTSISVHRIHLERKYINQLLGYGYQLQMREILSQPDQYACEETLNIVGPKGILKGTRVLGPEWNQPQVEVALTDIRALEVTPPMRASGDLTGMPDILLRGPKGKVTLEQGVIVADCHIHMSPEDATRLHVRDKELIQVEIGGEKPGIMGHVRIRVSSDYALDFHIDTDNGNVFLLKQSRPVKALTVQGKE